MKTGIHYGLLANVEALYGQGGAALTGATDGVDLIEMPEITVDYMHQGERAGKSPASTGARKRVGRMGRFGTGTVKIEPCGSATPFAAANVPNFHRWMRMGGWAAAVDTTADAETVTYTPSPVGQEVSGYAEAYVRGLKKVLAGILANTKMTCAVPGIPLFEFGLNGIVPDLPADAAVPAITYPVIEPPKAEAVLLQIGAWNVGNIKSIDFELNRNIGARLLNAQTGKHGGFVIGLTRVLTLKLVVEAVDMPEAAPFNTATEYNPFGSMESGEVQAIGFEIGGVQYNTLEFAAPAAQLVTAPEQLEGSVATWELNYELKPTTLVASDECSWIFR